MNPSPPVLRTRRRLPPWWLLLVLPPALLAAGLFAATGLAVRSFGMSAEGSSLRNRVVATASDSLETQVEIRAGTIPLSLARTVLKFVDVPPEARTALSALRGGEVGVYAWRPGAVRPSPAAVLGAADRALLGRGWDRVVTVLDEGELVAVFLPASLSSPRDVRCCVVVMDDEQLVLAGARGNLEPLLELAKRSQPWRERFACRP